MDDAGMDGAGVNKVLFRGQTHQLCSIAYSPFISPQLRVCQSGRRHGEAVGPVVRDRGGDLRVTGWHSSGHTCAQQAPPFAAPLVPPPPAAGPAAGQWRHDPGLWAPTAVTRCSEGCNRSSERVPPWRPVVVRSRLVHEVKSTQLARNSPLGHLSRTYRSASPAEALSCSCLCRSSCSARRAAPAPSWAAVLTCRWAARRAHWAGAGLSADHWRVGPATRRNLPRRPRPASHR